MGTRTSVFVSSDLQQLRDPEAVLQRLRRTEVACQRVEDYWRSTGSDGSGTLLWQVWEDLEDSVRFSGPGSLGLEVTSRAVRVHASARWRGFLSNPALRSVHLTAFRAIGEALGSSALAIAHDSLEEVNEKFWDGAAFDDCVAALRSSLGPPQATIESIEPAVVGACESEVPEVWYLEQVSQRLRP